MAKNLVDNTLSAILRSETFERYETYSDDSNTTAGGGLGILFYALMSCWLLFKYSNTHEAKFFALNSCLWLLTVPFTLTLPLVARVGFFFQLISIVCYQHLTNPKKDPVGFMFLLMILLIDIRGYFGFFESDVWHDAFAVYQTCFD